MNSDQIEYWSKFYSNNKIPNKNSNFSNFVINFLKNDISYNLPKIEFSKIKCLDCGCGNGRDSYYMSKYFNVTGIDTSIVIDNSSNCVFYKSDFCKFEKKDFNIIYSRFTFHSITNEQQIKFIESLISGQILCIETRSDLGKKNYKEHGDTHYRNYTNKEYLLNLLIKNNFEIIYLCETDDIAIYKKENPICIRVIAVKK